MTNELEKTLRELHKKYGDKFIGITRVYLESIRIAKEKLDILNSASKFVKRAKAESEEWMDEHNLTEDDLK